MGKNGCEDSHFHLAMKRIAPDSDRGLCYYVDPSPFLDRMQPVPKWTQECKDFTFKHIGDVVDFSKLTEGFALILEELKRYVCSFSPYGVRNATLLYFLSDRIDVYKCEHTVMTLESASVALDAMLSW